MYTCALFSRFPLLSSPRTRCRKVPSAEPTSRWHVVLDATSYKDKATWSRAAGADTRRTDIYRLLVVTPPRLSLPLPPFPHVIIDVAPRDHHHYLSTIYMYTCVMIKLYAPDICARTSFDPASRSRGSSGSHNTAAQQWYGVTPFNPL